MLIVYSSERRTSAAGDLGRMHYSYTFVEDAIVAMLKRNGFGARYVASPESLNNEYAATALLGAPRADVLHIAFRSTENFRPIRGARNVIHFAWEFDVMKSAHAMDEPVLSDQVAMLRLADEIWVGCNYTKRVFHRYGLTHCHVVPAPVAVAEDERSGRRTAALEKLADLPAARLQMASGLSRPARAQLAAASQIPLGACRTLGGERQNDEARVFGAVLNPADLRKNVLNLIDGFLAANAKVGGRDLLLLKLIRPNRDDFRGTNLFEELGSRSGGGIAYFADSVLVVADYLTGVEMDALYDLMDYYLCASHCEGFNLPLVESMARGVVPVSCFNTAMEDYLDSEVAIEISSRPFPPIYEGMAGDIAREPYEVAVADRFDVARAVRRAQTQPPSERRAMAERARLRAAERFGEADSMKRIRARFAAVGFGAADA